ncbi:Polynucleotidyl transferase, ribonuclease H-like superfamily protein [Prunus dulcis]|uniref:Polynucleotidyl transferase, ribonuclease H-like superfamily protein n=1 Tax=Prunus dulcis TaxID=3755 RepID=A0A4Y1RLP6_PRUDU|nr:Polynucleotidyl transferase, ribonuclease H-like superfamily protein [Prunus dulcis]
MYGGREDPNPKQKPIVIREVWAHNLESEFELIQSVIDAYPFISMDTEFPGLIFRPAVDPRGHTAANSGRPITTGSSNQTSTRLSLIQVGLTLSDSRGNLPDLGGSPMRFIWEFNFSDFDVARDPTLPTPSPSSAARASTSTATGPKVSTLPGSRR